MKIKEQRLFSLTKVDMVCIFLSAADMAPPVEDVPLFDEAPFFIVCSTELPILQ
jgi:hypothetical protein